MSPHGVQDRKLLNGVGVRTHLTSKVRAGTIGLGWRYCFGIGFSGLTNGIFCGGAVLDVASIAGSHAGGL